MPTPVGNNPFEHERVPLYCGTAHVPCFSLMPSDAGAGHGARI